MNYFIHTPFLNSSSFRFYTKKAKMPRMIESRASSSSSSSSSESYSRQIARRDLRCHIQITDIQQCAPVYYKLDGDRFKYPYTVKMLTESQFRFSLALSKRISSEPLSGIKVNGRAVEFRILRSNYENLIEIEFVWLSCSATKNRKKKRTFIKIEIHFANSLYVQVELQVKYYENRNSTHLNWGRELKHMLIETLPIIENRSATNVSQIDYRFYPK